MPMAKSVAGRLAILAIAFAFIAVFFWLDSYTGEIWYLPVILAVMMLFSLYVRIRKGIR